MLSNKTATSIHAQNGDTVESILDQLRGGVVAQNTSKSAELGWLHALHHKLISIANGGPEFNSTFRLDGFDVEFPFTEFQWIQRREGVSPGTGSSFVSLPSFKWGVTADDCSSLHEFLRIDSCVRNYMSCRILSALRFAVDRSEHSVARVEIFYAGEVRLGALDPMFNSETRIDADFGFSAAFYGRNFISKFLKPGAI